MKCPNCGKEIAEDSKFCEFCGSAIISQTQKINKSADSNGLSSRNGVLWCVVIIIGLIISNVFTLIERQTLQSDIGNVTNIQQQNDSLHAVVSNFLFIEDNLLSKIDSLKQVIEQKDVQCAKEILTQKASRQQNMNPIVAVYSDDVPVLDWSVSLKQIKSPSVKLESIHQDWKVLSFEMYLSGRFFKSTSNVLTKDMQIVINKCRANDILPFFVTIQNNKTKEKKEVSLAYRFK